MIPLFKPFMAQPAVNEAVCKVLSYREDGSLYCGEGPLVKRFEAEFAALVGADPAETVAVNSCSSALALALQLAGLDPNEHWRTGRTYQYEVISTPMTCTATNEAIVNAGAIPVWADIHPRSGLIDPADVARKITPRTKAIMVVNWGGAICEHSALQRHGLPIIEDAAHGPFGPNFGDYTCFSFGPIKHLTSGHGGMLITRRGDAPRGRKLRWHDLDRESSADFRCAQMIEEPGHLWHMVDDDAAKGLANLPHAEWVVARHRANAAFYDRALANLHDITLPPTDEGSSYWCYFLLVEDRADFMAFMAERGIAASPVHARNDTHPAYHFPNGPLPGVEHYAARNVAIPVGWWIGEQERQHVAGSVIEWAALRREMFLADPLRDIQRREAAHFVKWARQEREARQA